jgi:hypothetical protein
MSHKDRPIVPILVLLMRLVSTYLLSSDRAPIRIWYKLSQRYNLLMKLENLTTPNKDGWNRNKTRFQLIFGMVDFREAAKPKLNRAFEQIFLPFPLLVFLQARML